MQLTLSIDRSSELCRLHNSNYDYFDSSTNSTASDRCSSTENTCPRTNANAGASNFNGPISVLTFPYVFQQNSPYGVTPTPPMIVVQQPQPTMNVTHASTVNAPVIPQPLPQQLTRMFAMPANHLLPNVTSWTFPTRPVQPFTEVTTVLPPIQTTPATSVQIAHTPICTVATISVTRGGTCSNPPSKGSYIYTNCNVHFTESEYKRLLRTRLGVITCVNLK